MVAITTIIIVATVLAVGVPTGVTIYESISSGSVVILDPVSLAVSKLSTSLADGLGLIFTGIWDWLLYNIIAPLLAIVFVALFFIGQYYLFKLYFFAGKFVFNKIFSILNKINKIDFIKEEIEEFKKLLFS